MKGCDQKISLTNFAYITFLECYSSLLVFGCECGFEQGGSQHFLPLWGMWGREGESPEHKNIAILHSKNPLIWEHRTKKENQCIQAGTWISGITPDERFPHSWNSETYESESLLVDRQEHERWFYAQEGAAV